MNHSSSARSLIMAIFALAIVLSFSSMPAQASVIYDTSLAAPGVYFGGGNPNQGFTVFSGTSGGGTLELGLSAINRYIGPATEVGDQYYVPAGLAVGHPGAEWGFDFSINTNVGGAGSLMLSDFTFNITITDLDGTYIASFDPTLIPDNAYWNGAKVQAPPTPAQNTVYGMQNSEPLSFIPPTAGTYDPNAAHRYEITLSALPKNGPVIDPSISIFVNVQAVPEPATFGLAGIALLGLGLLRKKIKM